MTRRDPAEPWAACEYNRALREPPLGFQAVLCRLKARAAGNALAFGLAILLFLALPLESPGDEFVDLRNSARRELEIAKLELQGYLQIEFPRERRWINAEIELAQAEIAALRRSADPRSLFSSHRPAFELDRQCGDCRWYRRQSELRLNDLLAERAALYRKHALTWKLLEHRVQSARRRVAELEGGTEIILDVAALPSTGR